MGFLLLGASAPWVLAQTSVPAQLNNIRNQLSQPAQSAPAQTQTKPAAPSTQPGAKPQGNSPATAAAAGKAPVKPSTQVAGQTPVKMPPAGTPVGMKPATNPSVPAASNSAQGKPSAQGAAQATGKTTAPVAPVTAKAQPSKPGMSSAANGQQVKPGAPVPAQAMPVKSAVAASQSKAPAASSAKAGAAPAAQPKDAQPKDAQPKDAPAEAASASPAPERANVARRDPFNPLVDKSKEVAAGGPSAPLPAGKPGLVVASLRVDGVVKQSNGLIAIVSNPQMRVYFLREGDHLYDGDVAHITMEGVSFHQTGKDAFGKSMEREVTKRLYPTPGEPQ